MSGDVFILGGKRTPMGEYVGALKMFQQSIWARLLLEERWKRLTFPEKTSTTHYGETTCCFRNCKGARTTESVIQLFQGFGADL